MLSRAISENSFKAIQDNKLENKIKIEEPILAKTPAFLIGSFMIGISTRTVKELISCGNLHRPFFKLKD